MIIQTSCSELLVDTAIHDPVAAYERFSELFKELGWETSPPLTVELLEQLKQDKDGRMDVVVYDAKGNRAALQYGDNGYITTGYRFDSRCNDWDHLCYPIFKEAIEKLGGEIISCDGGTTGGYEKWLAGEWDNETDSD
jgi:hypothetical protein